MTSQSFKPARIFTLSVDINLKRKLDAEMRQIAEQTSEIEAQSSATDKEVKKLKERREKAKARQEELKGQKIDANKARTQWEKRRVTLATKRNLLEEERKKPTAQVEQERLTQRLRKLNNDMIGHARKMKVGAIPLKSAVGSGELTFPAGFDGRASAKATGVRASNAGPRSKQEQV